MWQGGKKSPRWSEIKIKTVNYLCKIMHCKFMNIFLEKYTLTMKFNKNDKT